jgi:hypothetical protein
VHGLTHDELTQHGANGSFAVAASGERRAPRTLQVNVASPTVNIDHLAEQQCSTVTEPR